MSEPDALPKVTLLELGLTFNKIALASFGGGLSAWSRQVVVDERKWMTDEEFLSAMTICRILPGANQVNLAVFIGTKFRGWLGALAAVVGLTAIPVVIVLVMGYFYFQYRELPSTQSILKGMAAAAVALTFSMAYKTGTKCLRSSMAWFLFAVAFALTAFWRMPLWGMLLLLGPIGFWWAWPRRQKS